MRDLQAFDVSVFGQSAILLAVTPALFHEPEAMPGTRRSAPSGFAEAQNLQQSSPDEVKRNPG
ncbi:MAG: hypothetical protein GY820_12135 [Gammaproteobacteria bacterium]|nr:hypothetical protein [Gammaproteobacteria bacterium]